MGTKKDPAAKTQFNTFLRGIWLFPAVLAVILIFLTAFKISGSSIGIYHSYFYGKSSDPALLLNKPRAIRSDEWLSNTQMDLAQKNAGYPKVNHNIGNGQDMSLILDVPYKDWSMIFKPHSLVFFLLPFDYAFAFKWWIIGYLLIISVYFFVLFFLPKRRLLASVLALSVFFSPFIQWWYQYITLGPIYYSLFLLLAFMYLVRSKSKKQSAWLGLLITYLLVCFALVQYPPFQISCALVSLLFVAGYLIDQRALIRKETLYKAGVLLAACVATGIIILGFLGTRHAAFEATKNTAYPGRRNVASGRYDPVHLFSSQLALPLQLTRKAEVYFFPPGGIANQSESSDFIETIEFLVVPSTLLLMAGYKYKRKVDWPLLSTVLLFVLLMVRLFDTHFSGFFKLILLNKVPQNRLVIGLGLLGIINLVLLIRNLAKNKDFSFPVAFVLPYSLLCLLFEIHMGTQVQKFAPAFISTHWLWLLSIPIPVMVYALLRKRFVLASSILLVFSIASAGAVHPLYRGTGVLTNTALSKDIRSLSRTDHKRWVTEGIMLENFASANGARSLSGVYPYPQLSLWQPLDPLKTQQDTYNRYAHIDFKVDRDPNKDIGASLELRGGDNIVVNTEACNSFLKKEDVGFILTDSALDTSNSCATLVDTVKYPSNSFFIYRLR